MHYLFDLRDDHLYIGPMETHPYPLHIHEAVEFNCILSGHCTVRVDGRLYELSQGDLVIVFPLVPHSFDDVSEDLSAFSALFLPDTISEFARTFHALLPDVPILRGAMENDDFRRIIDRLLSVPIEEPCSYRQAYLHLLLAQTLSLLSLRPAGTGNERTLTSRAIHYIYEHACEPINLTSVSYALGISRSHLSHLFSSQYRINFRRFINATRIHKAILQMRESTATLTQICENCGFENMRTFRRAFVQETGKLPSEYLRQIRSLAGDGGQQLHPNRGGN